jgi:hydroxyacylglutathione hydrolase
MSMSVEVKTISYDGVNCYLLKSGDDYFLVDTGYSKNRAFIDIELGRAGCRPGNLKLIIATHADFDHTGNCVWLRDKYGARIAMHSNESVAVERGDMLLNRKSLNAVSRTLGKIMVSFLVPGKFDRFKPDLLVEDGQDLSEYGIHARIYYLPGHSTGSIGILTAGGEFFCGDLLTNIRRPVRNSLVDNTAELNGSVERLKRHKIDTVYPGHGGPFQIQELTNP